MSVKKLAMFTLLLLIFSNAIYAHADEEETGTNISNIVSDPSKWPEVSGNAIIDAVIQIEAAQSTNKNVSSAKSELDEAIDFYKLKDYSSAYSSAQNALQLAINISKTNSSTNIMPVAQEEVFSIKQSPQYAIFGGIGIILGLGIGFLLFRAKKKKSMFGADPWLKNVDLSNLRDHDDHNF
ncbi:MAG: hypothetical protein AABX38_07525 [Candidatus Micrarchaeota archaeon]